MTFLLQQTMIYAVPLMVVALAGIYAERSGVINLALEGTMILGAFSGVLTVYLFQKAGIFHRDSGQLLMLLAMAVSALMGILFSLLLSFAAVNLKADQTIGGTALNLLAPALVLFFINLLTGQNTLDMHTGDAASWFMIKKTDLGFARTAKLGVLAGTFLDKFYLSTYLCILIYVILSVILYKTRMGMRLRACGENPQAADSLGIPVCRMRYLGVSVSGALAGIGGFTYALTTANCSSTGEVAGFGFLALAVMIFGNWKPLNTAFAAILFGLCKCITASYSTLDLNGDGVYFLREIGLNPNLYRMLPYLVTLLVLVFASSKSRPPRAEGIPYDPGKR